MQSTQVLKGFLDLLSAFLLTNVNISNFAPFRKTRILCLQYIQDGADKQVEFSLQRNKRNILRKLSEWSCRVISSMTCKNSHWTWPPLTLMQILTLALGAKELRKGAMWCDGYWQLCTGDVRRGKGAANTACGLILPTPKSPVLC